MPITVRVQNFQSIRDQTVTIAGFTVITGPNNCGKALRHGTPVATPRGWVPVEDLRVGDLVLAGDGSPTLVKGVYPQGVRPTWTVVFDDGRTATVDEDHLWCVGIGSGRFPETGKAPRRDVLSTREIIDRVGVLPTASRRPSIPTAGPAQYDIGSPLPIDPYLLGVLLGDGSLRPSKISLSTADPEILSSVEAMLPPGVVTRKSGKYDYRLAGARGKPNALLVSLKEMGLTVLSHEKFIPSPYRFASVSDRLALLQGLMDTDGYITKSGATTFYTTSTHLAEHVQEIVWSLGGKVRRTIKHPTYKYKGERKTGKDCHVLRIRLLNLDPFRLDRKKARVSGPIRRNDPLMVEFRPAGDAPCTCIEVAHPSHLFQIGGHLVTHNTALLRAIQGVFTNAPAGPLVRHGASHLTVDIDFGDGNRVRWEKGEKINRYTVNGKVLDNVGRGVPPEVAALGLSEIKAGSDRLWPNFAQQFGGVLFLVDRPGSVVAEALSDVDKVGRLTDALRAAESDKRAATADLKIRRKDVEDAKSSLEFYAGIDAVELLVDKSEIASEALLDIGDEFAKVEDLASRLGSARATVNRLKSVDRIYVPDTRKAEDTRASLASFIDLNARLKAARKGVNLLTPISKVVVPDNHAAISTLRDDLREAQSLRTRLHASRKLVGSLAPIDGVTLPGGFKPVAQQGIELREVQSLRDRLTQARKELDRLLGEIEAKQAEAEAAEQEVHDLLGAHGECPVCHTAFAHGASA